ncbi:phosphoribosyl-AMP cyclohydrolase [Brevundimonas sp. S30B]|uniref:phosphoribosyl-AMP cyclohydrolase n=1 Tax=unclassified Brevundimonas TaxID=2622653 RepID=UPI001071716D|nr:MULTISPECIES: phosphoribosyl-AMP cyclohydrolase [unclassified Brevundimonas]QBX38407.1 phosphoribosyl-AMP cyclohydrolase [Brevundimonas sp. MF30-B]TFW02116.1 phosphoribosyl-AMP cyclohydrolase [Brevundimonas sp. S30B]
MRKTFTLTALAALLAAGSAFAQPAAVSATSSMDSYAVATIAAAPSAAPITVAEVEAAQRAWGDALVAIATEYKANGQAAAARLAGQVLDAAYGYNLGPVAFKPTLASGDTTFRTTREGALAYFVGGNSRFAGDTGFALKGWRSYEIDNAAIVINGTTAISIGNVMLTNSDGQVTTVDKTWGWVRDPNGGLRIVLHHSSLPYAPN